MPLLCLSLALSGAQLARAQGKPIGDEELSDVWGQALFSLTNSSDGTYDFSRITLNADIKLNANLGGMRLGEYTSTIRNGTGADIDIAKLQFGRTDGTAAQRTVAVSSTSVTRTRWFGFTTDAVTICTPSTDRSTMSPRSGGFC